MVSKRNKAELREKKHRRIRNRLSGTPERPRLSDFRSDKHMYAQIIDDVAGNTLCAASTLDKDCDLKFTDNTEAAQYVGKKIAEKALAKGIDTVVFDRGGFLYHGKVAALADAAREAGLKF